MINGLCGELTGLGLLDGLLTLLELAFSYLLPLQVYEQLLLEGALLGQLNSNINLRNENLQYQLRYYNSTYLVDVSVMFHPWSAWWHIMLLSVSPSALSNST